MWLHILALSLGAATSAARWETMVACMLHYKGREDCPWNMEFPLIHMPCSGDFLDDEAVQSLARFLPFWAVAPDEVRAIAGAHGCTVLSEWSYNLWH